MNYEYLFTIGGPLHGQRMAINHNGTLRVPFRPPENVAREYAMNDVTFKPSYWTTLYEPDSCRIGSPQSGLFVELHYLRWHMLEKDEAIRQACGLLFAQGINVTPPDPRR